MRVAPGANSRIARELRKAVDVVFADKADPALLRHMREEAKRGAPAVRAP